MRKLKLLQLNAGTNLGGTEIMLLRFLDNVDRNRFQVIVGAFFDNDPLISEVQKRGFEGKLFRIKNCYNPFAVLIAFFSVYRFLKSRKVDIIHLYGFYTNILGKIAARFAKTPIVVTGLRMERFGKNFFHSLLARITDSWTDLYIAVSQRTKALMLQKRWLSKKKVIVIHSGIDPKWSASSSKDDNPDTQAPQAPWVGMVGAFNQFKAQEKIVLSAPLVLKNFPTTRFILVGEGKTKERIIRMIAKLGLKPNFDLFGTVSDIRPILSKLSVFVFASRTEGLPVAILEAMAFGLPVVASCVGGIPELIEDGVTGILVKSNEPEEFASAIIQLLSNPAKARLLGKMGRLRIQKEFNLKAMTRRLEEVYHRLAEEKGIKE
ncbi:MAG: glycosyltransferase [candidate division WOR-3 bacterium]